MTVPLRLIAGGVVLGVLAVIVTLATWEVAALLVGAVTLSGLVERVAAFAVYLALALGLALGVLIGRLASLAER